MQSRIPRKGCERSPSYTKAQTAVLRILAKGASNAEIAVALRIQVSTVKRHVGSIMLKAEVRNRVQLALQYLSTLTAEEKERHLTDFRVQQEKRAFAIGPVVSRRDDGQLHIGP